MLAFALLMLALPVRGQRVPKPLPIDLLLSVPTLFHVGPVAVFAADGEMLAYTVVDNRRRLPVGDVALPFRTGVPLQALGADIWLSNTTKKEDRNLTKGNGNSWGPSWSPDGRRIAFLSDRQGGAARLWTWDRASGRFHRVSDLPILAVQAFPMRQLEWTADSRAVVVMTYPLGMSPDNYAELITRGRRDTTAVTDTGSTATVFSFDPGRDSVPQAEQFNLDRWLGDLALVEVETGRVERLSHGMRICNYSLSPDRRLLAWAVAERTARPGSQQLLVDLFVSHLETGKSRRLIDDARLASDPEVLFSWSPASDAITYRAYGPGIKDEIYVVTLDGRPPTQVADGPNLHQILREHGALWDATGRYVFFVRAGELWRVRADGAIAERFATMSDRRLEMIAMGSGQLWSPDGGRSTISFTSNPATKRMGLARIDLKSGAITQLVEEDRWYGGYLNSPVVAPDGKAVVYAAEDARHPPNLWLLRADGQPAPRQVSHIGSQLEDFDGGTAKLIDWRGLDGDTLRGALIYPAGYRQGTRYPLLVSLYGGVDVSNDLNRFGFAVVGAPVENLQVFAGRGYAVLLADSRLNQGTPMQDLLKTVLPGVDRAIDFGLADPNRIGIIGHSYGGYSALALIVQSRRFKAAVVRAGLGDLIAAYGQLSPDGTNYGLPWAETGQGRMGGTPWEFRERYLENSPILYLDRVEAPLLIVHGEADQGVSPFLTGEIFVGLRRLSKRVDYVRYGSEGHWEGLWKRSNQIDYLTRVIGWFDQYLRGTTSPHIQREQRTDAP